MNYIYTEIMQYFQVRSWLGLRSDIGSLNKIILEILGVGGRCVWGHKKGQRLEVDIFNTGEVCGLLYSQAYRLINVLLSEKNSPWEKEPHIAHGVCPDTHNLTTYRLIRESR